MTWIERDHPERSPKHIRTAQLEIRDDSVVVLSYRDYYDKYIQHPEAKALAWTPLVLSLRPLGLTGRRDLSRWPRPRAAFGRRARSGAGGGSGR